MAQFEWGIAREGYVWCDARPFQDPQSALVRLGGKRFLIPVFTLAWKRYYPMEEKPALYREFAAVEPTEVGIQAFANKYGFLGLGEPIAVAEEQHSHGEDLLIWQAELCYMAHAVCVWEAIQGHDHAALARWFRLEKHERYANIYYEPDTPWPFGVPRVSPQTLYDQEQRDITLFLFTNLPTARSGLDVPAAVSEPDIPTNAAGLALAWLQCQLNVKLTAHVALYVGYMDDPTSRIPLALQTMPKNLCGALWLQFALALRGTERDQQCRQCGEWFRVPAKARRASTAYCSTRCRVKAARQRQASAMQGV